MVANLDSMRGIYSALVTPMDRNEQIDHVVLRDLVEFQLTMGVEGFYCCGSSGEALLLSLEEREEVVRTVVDQVAGRVPVIAHVGTIRTADTIRLAKHAYSDGASAVSMIPPYYYKFSQEEILGYYEDVVKETQVPVIIYNIPQFTGISFNKDNAGKLLEHEMVIGVKHTSTDLYGLERMRTAYPDKIYFNGFDETFLSALSAGADSAVGTTVNLFAPRFLKIRSLFNEGKMKDALDEQSKVNTYVETLVRHGIFNGVKYALALKGFSCGTCRAPFKPLSDVAKQEISLLISDFFVH